MFEEKCFYSGRDSSGDAEYIKYDLLYMKNPDGDFIKTINIVSDFSTCMLKNFGLKPIGYINLQLWIFNIQSSLIYLNECIENVYNLDVYLREKFKKNKGCMPEEMSRYYYEKKNIIHTIKYILDEFISLSCIKLDPDFFKSNQIQISSIGELLNNKRKSDILALNIKTNISFSKFENFIQTINDLHNAYKHTMLDHESKNQIGSNNITFFALYTKYGALNKTYILNSVFNQIIIGFNDFLFDVIEYEEFTGSHSYRTYPPAA